jgi:hypothetical protein
VDAHFLADDINHGRRTVVDVGAGAQVIDRERGVVAVSNRPNDVLGAEGGVAAEEDARMARRHRLRIDLGHVPLVKLDADIALDPRKSVLLADCDQHVVASEVLIGLAGWNEIATALGVVFGLDLLEHHAGEATVLVGELFRHEEIQDRDVLVHGVLLLPGRRLHLLKAGADDHLDVLAAEPAR